MQTLEELRKINPALEILPITDRAYTRYGRVIEDIDASREIAAARARVRIGSGVVYDPEIPELAEAGGLYSALTDVHYGGMPVQLGWCYGRNLSLDALEYHKGSEINVAVSDCVVMLAHYDDIHWEARPWIDSAVVKLFYIPAGTVFEFYAWCLHFAPLHVREKDGFCILVGLPQGTNTPLEVQPAREGEAIALLSVNKWLFAHPEAEGLIKDGAYVGIRGENIKMKPIP